MQITQETGHVRQGDSGSELVEVIYCKKILKPAVLAAVVIKLVVA